MRYLFLLLLIIASITTFSIVIIPRYNTTKIMASDVANYSSRLQTANKLKLSREDLINRYNSIPKADLDNLKTLLPDSVDNIRLIIQIDSLATKNGLSSLRNVQYDTTKSDTAVKPDLIKGPQKPYGEFTISFETVGPYSNFLSFISDLEQNLRLVDVSQVTFAQDVSKGLSDSFKYDVTLKTYWLKK